MDVAQTEASFISVGLASSFTSAKPHPPPTPPCRTCASASRQAGAGVVRGGRQAAVRAGGRGEDGDGELGRVLHSSGGGDGECAASAGAPCDVRATSTTAGA